MAWEVRDPKITPPHIKDPEAVDVDVWAPGREGETPAGDIPDSGDKDDLPNFEELAREAYRDSTSYVDANYRKHWEDSLRAFNNEHRADSKYNADIFRKRSHSFVPKTRAVIRKNEAAAASAFFSNLDAASIQPTNQADAAQRLSATLMQELVQYRLTHTIPWFLVLIGAVQDAQTQGACIAHVHWRYRPDRKKLKALEDRPLIDLVPIENIRFHPAADWMDPLHSSPYLIHLIPMYVGQVKERMRRPDPKGAKWREYDEATLLQYLDFADDSTRQTRLGLVEDPTRARSRIRNYDVLWVHRHIHRIEGEDYEWYTVASELTLSDPVPLNRVVFHGRRPYELGRAVLETHKPMPSSIPELLAGLQEDLNDTRNQRSDNVKFVLNKRYLVKRGANVDMASLVRNVPGGITQVNNVEGEVKELAFPDVTQSSYLEEDRITGNFDELAGNFNPLQVAQQRTPRESERTMLAVQSPANLLTEYLLKTLVETFVLPVLRQLVLLEQYYETDERVLAIAGDKAKVREKFGIDAVTDQMLEGELTTQVNVGMGATDPVMKLQRFIYGMNAAAQLSLRPPVGINLGEVYKEIFALSGYQDGSRFMSATDPEKLKLQQQLKQLTQLYRAKIGQKEDANLTKLQIARERNVTDLLRTDKTHQHQKRLALADYWMKLAGSPSAAAAPGAPPPSAQPQPNAQPMPGAPAAQPGVPRAA